MSDGLSIRPAGAGEAHVLAATIVAAFEQYRGRLEPESGALRETVASIAAELREGSRALVAARDGAVAGCVMIKPVERDVYFGRLSVLPAARGLGVARRLIVAVEADARARGAEGVRLSVRVALPDNQRLFASLGYVETGREAHAGFAVPTMIHMRKPL